MPRLKFTSNFLYFHFDRAFIGPTIGGVLVEQFGFPWACFGVVVVFGICVSRIYIYI